MPLPPRLAVLSILLFGIPALTAADLATTAGKKYSGELVSVDVKSVDFKAGGRLESLPATQVQVIDFAPVTKSAGKDKEKSIAVELVDGSVFRCSAFKIKGRTAEMQPVGGWGKTLQIPVGKLYTMFRDPDNLKLAADFQSYLKKRGKRDVMLMRKGDGLDAVEGTFGDGDGAGELVQFDLAGGASSPIKQSRMLGMVFNQPPEGEKAQAICKLIDKAGNTFVLKALKLDGPKLSWSTVSGVDVEDFPQAELAKLDFTSGTLRYLSDLEPVKAEESSTEGQVEKFKRDTNLDGREIVLKKDRFTKGLSLHSRTVLTYDVEGYREFRAVVGVDDEVESDSRVTLKIEADGKPLFTQTVLKADAAKPLTLGIQNIKNLRITVESELLDLGNQVTLADARILK